MKEKKKKSKVKKIDMGPLPPIMGKGGPMEDKKKKSKRIRKQKHKNQGEEQ